MKERRIAKVFRSVRWSLQIQFVNEGKCPYQLEDLQQITLWKIINYNKIVESYLCNYTNINQQMINTTL